ncbi:MAG: PEP-CTERM sorting domain-containing protein [Desulfococcaceae bacterium]
MKRTGMVLLAGICCMLIAQSAWALSSGAISTDRFGYTGVVKRFDTLDDAQNGVNQVGTDIEIGNRDLSLYVVNDYSDFNTDYNIMMGSWWYTTDPDGRSGWGNTRGNSGRGYVQLYDTDGSTDTSVEMSFGNNDGSYWRDFNLSLSGGGADYSNDYARFWLDYQGGGADMVKYHSYDLNLTASGLEGAEISPGWIEAANHPTSVTGNYSGIFENVSTSYTQNNGFYTFDLALDMENWAWANRDDLVGDEFSDSYFAAAAATEPIPEPGTFVLFGIGIAGWFVSRRVRASGK